MDHRSVEAPVAPRATALERDFFVDFPLLVNYVARLIDSVDDAPAIACEAYRQAVDRAGGAAASTVARAEIFRTATELSREMLRPRRWFRRRPRQGVISLEDFPRPEDRRALRRDTVQRALAALSFEARAIILLRDYSRLSYEEVSEVLGIPPKKLVHALDRGRGELVEIYEYIKF